jgi:hypothetical protein
VQDWDRAVLVGLLWVILQPKLFRLSGMSVPSSLHPSLHLMPPSPYYPSLPYDILDFRHLLSVQAFVAISIIVYISEAYENLSMI